jgi:predicted site-specific integrase-resolvase
MNARDVMRILRISKSTLYNYRKQSRIPCTLLPNGRYNYDDKAVYELANKGNRRKVYVYVCVRSKDAAPTLEQHLRSIEKWCFGRGIMIDKVVTDISPTLAGQRNFWRVMKEVLNYAVETIIIIGSAVFGRQFTAISRIMEMVGTSILETQKSSA